MSNVDELKTSTATAAEAGSAKKARPAWVRRGAYMLGALSAAGLSVAVTAQVAEDYFGDPPATDESAYVTPDVGDLANEALKLLEHSNHGSFEGTTTGTKTDVFAETALPLAQQTSEKIPTGGRPSPLFRATSFSFPMLTFEEFGPEKLDPSRTVTNPLSFPRPKLGAAPELHPTEPKRSGPGAVELEAFLAQPIHSGDFPTHHSNHTDENPWNEDISKFVGRAVHGPAEGRPPGEGWAHQRFNEMYPQTFVKTVQGTARKNLGFRDKKQLHGYQVGEFAPGGLYHNTFGGLSGFNGTTKGITPQFHSGLPVQHRDSVWTFDGTMPPKLLMTRLGEGVLMRHFNGLPIDPAANKGFGLHTITTHMHNGHNPAESDGVAQAFFFPGQYYDYRWPMQLAAYDTVNTGATDPRAGYPCKPGEALFVNDATPGKKVCPANGIINVRGDWREIPSTLWFHDHMLDFTAQNVYKGNAAMVNIYSSVDRGNETFNCQKDDPTNDPVKSGKVNLCFPSGSGMSWGNRDYDVNLVIADKAWDKNGQLWFNVFNKNGFLGDRILTNFTYHPYFDVRARRYRFRILNGAVSRYFSLALVKEVAGNKGELKGPTSSVSYDRVPFHMIANDGNIMEHAVAFDGTRDLDGNGDAAEHKGTLPQQAIGERYDIIVDFAKHGIKPGDKLYFVNVQEHTSPEKANKRIPLADVLSGKYKPAIAVDTDGDKVLDRWENGDPGVGMFMQFRVKAMAAGQVDNSMDPADYVEGKKKMVPLKLNRDNPADHAKLQTAIHRDMKFGHSGGTDDQPWTVKVDLGTGYNADMRRISAAPKMSVGPTKGGSVQNEAPFEVWYLELAGGWDHPVHIHFEEGIILRRDGKQPPAWEKYARKDIYRIGPDLHAGSSVEVALQFREFAGTFVEHCHATQHEDNAMLIRWDLERPGQTLAMPTPMPSWDGVHYTGSAALTTFRSGVSVGTTYTLGN